jgi:hypothetical protein
MRNKKLKLLAIGSLLVASAAFATQGVYPIPFQTNPAGTLDAINQVIAAVNPLIIAAGSGSGTPGGGDGQMQYNNAGTFGGVTLTTTGTTGPATISSGTLNIPQYAGSGSSVSVTAASNDIVINPSPGTGTFTVGSTQLINAQGTAATYTVQATDMGKTVTHAKTTAVAVTLPQSGTAGFGVGVGYCEQNLGVGPVTITPATSTINGKTSVTLMKSQEICPISDGTNWSGVIGGIPVNPQTVAISAAAIATDFSMGPVVYATLTHLASTAISNPTNPVDAQFLLYALAQDSTGTNLVTWDTAFDFGANGTPTLTTTASKVDYLGFRYNANLSKWVFQGSALGN